jgi:YVTN family beta-propeller protein
MIFLLVIAVLAASAPAPAPAPTPAPVRASASTGSGTLIVLDKASAKAHLIALGQGGATALGTVPTGVGPHEVAVSPDGGTAVVSNYGEQTPGSTLTVIDVKGRLVRSTIDLGTRGRPHGLAFLPDGRLLVTSEASRSLVIVDPLGGTVLGAIPTDQDGTHMVVTTRNGSRAFTANVGSGSVSAIDVAAGKVVATIATAPGAEGIDLSPDESTLWVTNNRDQSVSVVDVKTLKVLTKLPCQGFPIRAKFTPDGKRVVVSLPMSGELAVFDAVGRREVARVPVAEPGQESAPIGVLVHPSGALAYVAELAAGRVAVVDLSRGAVVARIPAGRHPDGLGLVL